MHELMVFFKSVFSQYIFKNNFQFLSILFQTLIFSEIRF